MMRALLTALVECRAAKTYNLGSLQLRLRLWLSIVVVIQHVLTKTRFAF